MRRDDNQAFQSDLFDAVEGERRKERGLARAIERTDPKWKEDFVRQVVKMARWQVEFTSEDVCAIVGRPPRPNAVGAMMSQLAKNGVIMRVGYGKARRANQHSAMISIWRGVT